MSEFKEWDERQYSVDYARASGLGHPMLAYSDAIKAWGKTPHDSSDDLEALALTLEALIPQTPGRDVESCLMTTELLLEIMQEEKLDSHYS